MRASLSPGDAATGRIQLDQRSCPANVAIVASCLHCYAVRLRVQWQLVGRVAVPVRRAIGLPNLPSEWALRSSGGGPLMDIEPCDTLEERGTLLGYNHRRPSEQQNLRLQNANNHVLRWPQQQS